MSLDIEQYAGAREFPVVDAGEYEVVLKITKKRTKDNTKDYANLDFMIRDDVEQKFQGAHDFDKVFRDPGNPEWFDTRKFGSILVTQKEKEGYKAKWDEVDELIQWLNGVNLKVTIEKVYDDYTQKEDNRIKYLSYKPSALGPYVKPVKDANGNVEEKQDQAQASGNVENIDIPKDERKVHAKPMPRIGGLSFIMAFLISMVYILLTSSVADNLSLFMGFCIPTTQFLFSSLPPIATTFPPKFSIADFILYFSTSILFISSAT